MSVRILHLTIGFIVFGCSSATKTHDDGAQQAATSSESLQSTDGGVTSSIRALSISSGSSETCAVLRHHETRCWGENESGELGIGTQEYSTYPPTTTIPTLPTAKTLTAGGNSTCGISQEGQLYCWGATTWGQLGIGDVSDQYQLTPAPVRLPALAKKVATANFGTHACAIVQGGDLYCWGTNDMGQLGVGNYTDTTAPTVPAAIGDHNVVDVAVGYGLTCALQKNGKVKCWGSNLTDPSGAKTNVPGKAIALPSAATGISVGTAHICAVLDTGEVDCWGNNYDGEVGIGDPNTFYVPSPQKVALEGPAVSVSCGSDDTCAVLADGRVECWGNNFMGQLGTGDGVISYAAPVLIDVGFPVSTVASGFFHRCALSTTGDVKCWGYNGANMLGLSCWPSCQDTSIIPPSQLANIQF